MIISFRKPNKSQLSSFILQGLTLFLCLYRQLAAKGILLCGCTCVCDHMLSFWTRVLWTACGNFTILIT